MQEFEKIVPQNLRKDQPNRILMGCNNAWESPFQVGSHQIARVLLNRGWQVGFISDPISPFHFFNFNNPQIKNRFEIYKQGGKWLKDSQLWTYVPGAVITPHNKPFLRSKWVVEHWHDLTIPSLKQKNQQQGFQQVDLLYLDSLAQSFWLDHISYKKSIFRIADNYSGFSKFNRFMLEEEKKIIQNVDLVVYAAKSLQEYVNSFNPQKTLNIPNGVNSAFFIDNDPAEPNEYRQIPHPIVVYVGAIDEWFDFESINIVARALPNFSFVFIGPYQLAKKNIRDLPNIYMLGKRDYHFLPAYLKHADLGIIPFNVAGYPRLVNSIHPLKLYEYMACGLDVVASSWEELILMNSPAYLYKTTDEFIHLIKHVIQNPTPIRKLENYARQNDWNNRVNELLVALK